MTVLRSEQDWSVKAGLVFPLNLLELDQILW